MDTLKLFSGWFAPLMLVAAILIWIAKTKGKRTAGVTTMSHFTAEVRKVAESFPAFVWAAAMVCVFTFFLIRNIYENHRSKVETIQKLESEKHLLEADITDRRHNLRPGEPAYENTEAIISAFRDYRKAIGSDSHELIITIPRDCDCKSLSSMLSAIGNTASGLAINTPSADYDPTWRRLASDGVENGKIVYHTRKGDKAALRLYDSLSSKLPLVLSFDVPSDRPSNFVWFQFGPKTKWSSEIREEKNLQRGKGRER